MAVMSILGFGSIRWRKTNSPSHSTACYAVVFCNEQGIIGNISGVKHSDGAAFSMVYKVRCSRR